MEIPTNHDSLAGRDHVTHRVAAVRLVTDHLAVIAEIANRMAVMNAGRIVEQCPQTAILEDRQHLHPVVVPHE